MIGDGFHAKRSGCTDVMTCREESPSPPAPGDASATRNTCDDITKSPAPWRRPPSDEDATAEELAAHGWQQYSANGGTYYHHAGRNEVHSR